MKSHSSCQRRHFVTPGRVIQRQGFQLRQTGVAVTEEAALPPGSARLPSLHFYRELTNITQQQHTNTHQQPVGVGLHYQLPIWVDTSRLLASHNYNTPTAGRRGATLSATYLGGHLTFTSITQLQHTNSREAWGYTISYLSGWTPHVS